MNLVIFRICVLHIEESDSNDFWENNWLSALLEANFPGFKVSLRQSLRKDNFAACQKQLGALLLKTDDKAFFYTIEDGISIHFFLEENDKIRIKGKLTSIDLMDCSFNFNFIAERSNVESFKNEIEYFLNENPIVGIPY